MIAPSADSLLRVWEDHQRAHPVQQALAALSAASPELERGAWAAASIGERDGGLLVLHESLFGSELCTTAACPQCGERLESDFSARDIRSHADALPGPQRSLRVQQAGYDIEYRLPTSDDLLQLAGADDPERAAERAAESDPERQLLRRCVSRAQLADSVLDPASLPDDVVAGIAADMARHDPDADVRIALECPACGMAWQMRFDIVSYFWGEFDDWAQRLLADVHALASAYGWSERAILALSPTRRQIYLDMVGV